MTLFPQLFCQQNTNLIHKTLYKQHISNKNFQNHDLSLSMHITLLIGPALCITNEIQYYYIHNFYYLKNLASLNSLHFHRLLAYADK